MKAVVLCAGMGTRLGPLTANTPKPMLRVGGEPLLAHTLRHLARHGIDWVAVNLHFMPEIITAYFGDGSAFGVRIHYAHEQALLGTAGTLRALRSALADTDETLVVYGDLLTDQDFGELAHVHRERGADATLLLHERAGSNSLVRMSDDGRVTAFVERPDAEERQRNPHPWVNSGVAVVGPKLLASIPDAVPADLPKHVYVPLLSRLHIYGVPLTGYRCAIDSPARLAEAEDAITSGRCSATKQVTRV
jgi:mannose-1-phosphate guanylyltransferase/phosphomannomutase